MKYLDEKFFLQKTLRAAEDLVGCYIVRKIGKKKIKLLITETEAYIGPHDLACHSSKGRTKRTEIMFGEPGTIYVYMIYGIHFMLNIVTEKKDYPAAILVRGAGEYTGPGKLSKVLEINMKLNGKKAVPQNGIWFEPHEDVIEGKKEKSKKIRIKKAKRIGVEYAGPIWAEKKYRFVLGK